MDIYNKQTVIPFDLVEEESPHIVGKYVKRYADTHKPTQPPTIVIRRPSYTATGVFHTYIAKDSQGSDWVRVEVITHRGLSSASLVVANQRCREGAKLG